MNTPENQSGFTLVEMLIVLAIIGLLTTLGLTMLRSGRDEAEILEAKAFIQSIDAALETYKLDRKIGVYPPTTLESFNGLGKLKNRTNMGIESLVVCLNSPNYKGDRILETYEKYLQNVDGDQSAKPLTYMGAKDLFEIVDPWGNPYAYFNAEDYDRAELARYTVADAESGESSIVTVKPWTSGKTQTYRNATRFQLISAGPDGVFNTEDDIGNW
ncbi:MAG: prepilin-type N-terminal cleavage/methylation domain-containing protein [Planctomycetota bacterium]